MVLFTPLNEILYMLVRNRIYLFDANIKIFYVRFNGLIRLNESFKKIYTLC